MFHCPLYRAVYRPFLRMESASPEQPSEQPPGHIANFVGIVIATMTLTLPLYAVSNFNTAEVSTPQRSSVSFMKAQE